MASIFQRIRTVLAANINSLITKAEDPEKMLDQLVLDMQNQFVEARQQVAAAMADEQRLRKQWENEARIASEWENKARLALTNGREDLAREALARQAEHEKMASEFRVQVDQQSAAVEQLRGALTQLNSKIEEAKRKKTLLLARAKRAEAQKKIQDTMSGLGDNSAFEAFNRMEGKVDQLEAEATVSAQFAGELAQGDELDKQFKQLEAGAGNTAVDAKLLEMKAKLGMLPAPGETSESK